MLTDAPRSPLSALVAGVLERSWREGRRVDGVPFAYTCPSPGHYPWQWYWDSCFTAITWRRLNRDRARRELASLLAAQRDDGFIGHTIFWTEPLRFPRTLSYNRVRRGDPMTSSIQPPLLAWAWRIAVGDPREVPALARHHAWLAEHRDLEGDGLLWIVQPDESGQDASPQFDPIWGRRAHSTPAFPLLVRRNRRLGFDLRRVAAAGGPVVLEVLTNVLYNLSRLALGLPSLTGALIARAYDERRGLFCPEAYPDPGRPLPVSIAALSPLALPDLPEAIGRRLVEEHLLDPARFWLPVAPPSVSAREPGFALSDRSRWGFRRYWRGPTWVNTAWLVWLGLRRLGYDEAADALAGRLAATVMREGLREYYHPYTGQGMGAADFGWSSLILEMAEPDPGAADGHLGPRAAG